MVRFENVAAAYPGGKEIFSGVSLHLKPGSFHFLSGRSGAGKSTMLGLLSLTLRPSAGKVHLFGKDVTTLPREKLPMLRRKIGMVFQDFRLLPHLTVRENIALPAKVAGMAPKEMDKNVREMLDWAGLDAFANAYPHTLSGGQKQKAAIARAVINKPELILADEPTGNLDPDLGRRFMFLFSELNRMGTTILFATHDEMLMEQFTYPVLRLEEGRLIAEYPPAPTVHKVS